MSVLGVNQNVLESQIISNASPTAWSSNFVGIERPELISSVIFTGDTNDVLRIDDVTFEVPEPSGAVIPIAIAFVVWCRRPVGRRCNHAPLTSAP
jgi:hypothetical protein